MNHSEIVLYDIYIPVRNPLEKIVPIIWYAVGLVGNALAFTVWSRRRMRHSSGCYLAALAVADEYFLVCHLVYVLHTIWETGILNQAVFCESFGMFFLASQYLSPMLVLAFTTERYISICHPFSSQKYCTSTIATRVTIAIYVFAHLLASTQLYFLVFKDDEGICDTREYSTFWIAWTWVTEMLIFVLLPMSTLVFNILVIREVMNVSRRGRRNSPVQLTGESSGNKNSTTVMLLSVSFYYIVTSIPVTTVYSIYPYFQMGNSSLTDAEIRTDPKWQRHFSYIMIKTIISQIGLSHYALNFYIYLITGKMFRRHLFNFFSRDSKSSYVETAV